MMHFTSVLVHGSKLCNLVAWLTNLSLGYLELYVANFCIKRNMISFSPHFLMCV